MPITLGQLAYEAYSKHARGKTYNGKPTWAELHADIQIAWDVAAMAVVNEIVLLPQQEVDESDRLSNRRPSCIATVNDKGEIVFLENTFDHE